MLFLFCQFLQDPREDVIQAWYMDDNDEDQRLPHHREPKEFVSLDKLAGNDQAKHYTYKNYLCGIENPLSPPTQKEIASFWQFVFPLNFLINFGIL